MATDPQRAQANQPPALQLDGPLSYTENDPATLISPNALLSDSDDANLYLHTLTVSIRENRTVHDHLAVRNEGEGAGKIRVFGKDVYYGSQLFGRIYESGFDLSGAKGTDLKIALNYEAATVEAVQALIRNITYWNSSDAPSTAPRSVAFIFTDQTTGASSEAVTTVNVAATPDPPLATDDRFATDERSAIGGDLLADNGYGPDWDGSGTRPSIVSVNGSAGAVGTQIRLDSGALVTVRADGTFEYDPNHAFDHLQTGQQGSDGFAYTLSNGTSATVQVAIAGFDSDSDRIVGTTGDDTLYAIGGGADELVGLAGNDRYFINSSDDRVVEQQGEGRDRVYTITDYVLPANVEELLADPDRAASIASGLRLTGNALANTIYGSHRDDVINGAAGADFMSGGSGNDLYFVDDPADYVSDFDPDRGNAGIDTVVTSVSFNASQQGNLVERIQAADIYGTAPLSLIGNYLDNHLWGTHGDNVLNGAGGADFMAGYAGNDLYYVDHRDDVAYEERNGGTDMVATTVSYTLGANVENLQANDIGGTAPLRLTGNALSNNIYGTQGNNVLNGAGGADFMAGYAGHDLYYVDHEHDVTYEDRNGGIDTVATRVDYRLGANIENLQANDIGGTDPLRLTGNALANNIWGTQGNNVLNGGGGADFMAGYAGNDLYYVDHWGDLAYEDSNGGTDTVSAKVDYRLPANVENLQANDIYGTDPLSLTGNALANSIWGTHGDNLIAGRGGIDQLYGYAGADRFLFNTAPGRDNYDFLGDFQAGVDKILLDNSVYTALTDGALAPGAFRAGAAAADADDRIIFNPQNGGVFYDPDGSGAGAAVLLAIVPLGQTLTSNDFLVI